MKKEYTYRLKYINADLKVLIRSELIKLINLIS